MFRAYTIVPSGNVTCVPGLGVDVPILLMILTIAHRTSSAGWSPNAAPWQRNSPMRLLATRWS